MTRGYAICATARSGSNFIGQLCESTGALGVPLEYFNGPARRALGLPDYPDEPAEQVKAILDLGCTPNGVYALKLFPFQFRAVQHVEWTGSLPNLHFVHLTRGDLLGQAISWARAIQTGQYRSTSQARGSARYDSDLVRGALSALVSEDSRWRLWFARTGIQPLHILYEVAAANPQSVADQIGQMLGLEQRPLVNLSAVDVGVQRDAESDEWRSRFLRENGSRSEIEPEYGIFGIPGRVWPTAAT
jgi:LPS sulfotransferase NodH